MNILHLDSSILGDNSVSRKLSAAAIAKLMAANPASEVVYRDLCAAPLPHLSGAYLGAAQSPAADHEPAIKADLEASSTVLKEFLAADTVVIGVALYNFTISSQLKAWVDRILVAGQTFRYGSDGRPQGLVGAKQIILTIARGGIYAPGSPTAPYEHAETYLRTVFGFIGIINPTVVVAEGLAMGPDHRQAAISQAEAEINKLAA